MKAVTEAIRYLLVEIFLHLNHLCHCFRPQTKLAVLDHIPSNYGLILPMKVSHDP